MARAKASTWCNLIAGLLAGVTAQPLVVMAGPDSRTPADPQNAADASRPVQGNRALAAASEAVRRGDYQAAERYLQQAKAEAANTTPADPWEQHEIMRVRDALTVAVQARQAGNQQITLAEDAMRQGQQARAADLIRRVSANEPFLSEPDRVRLAQLTQKVRAQAPTIADKPAPAPMNASAPGGALATAQARAKLKQARTQMAQFNFERTEALVHEAERLQPKLSPTEDSPKKVLDDLARIKSDPKALLTASRVALGRKDYDHAEQFAHMSEKNSGPFTFPFWGDSPSRVLKDVQELRKHEPAPVATTPKTPTNTTPPVKPVAKNTPPVVDTKVVPAAATTKAPAPEPAKPAPGSPEATRQAEALIKQSRQAIATGDAAKARKLNDQARALKPNLHWWEDNPEKVQADIVKLELKTNSAVTPVAAKTPVERPGDKNKPLTKDEAVALVKKGRVLLADNKIDEATQVWLKARNSPQNWGLFEDTPEKLHQDIDKVRTKRDREESVKVLADARRLYEEGKYDEASKAAFRAQKLHGAYNIWDLGDRPERVLADVETAKVRLAKGQPVEVVKRTQPAKPATDATAVVRKPATTPDARAAKARQMLADARVALSNGDTARAKVLAEQVRSMHVVLNAPGDDSPEAVLVEAQRAKPAATAAVASRTTPPAADAKPQVVKLMADARELQKAHRLLEARDKVVAAQQLHVVFNPGEETPETVMQSLAAEARFQVEWLVREVVNQTGSTGPDMAVRFQKAEQMLVQARSLAAGFGFDARPIDGHLEWVHSQLAMARGETKPPAPVMAAAPKNRGEELLANARVELQRGELEKARKLAETAAQGDYGVQDEAFAVLRSIGAEEVNQRRMQSNRTFDAAQAAYNRRDFANASNLIQSIDANSLDESRRARLREIVMTPEMRPAGQSAVTQVQAISGQNLPSVPTPPSGPTLGEQPGVARAADTPTAGDALISQTEAMQQVKFQKLRQDGQEAQREATEKFRTGQTDAAIEVLQEYLARVGDSQLEPNQVVLLRRQPEARLQQYKLLKEQRDFLSEQDGKVKLTHETRNREFLNEQNKEKKVAELMKQTGAFMAEGKYAEAEQLAMQAHELDPDNAIAGAAVTVARMQKRMKANKDLNDVKDEIATSSLLEVDNIGPDGIGSNDIVLNKKSLQNARERGRNYGTSITTKTKSEREKDIERRLLMPVTLNFTDTPLKSVIEDLRAWQSMNIWVDKDALLEENISLDKPVSIKLDQLPMKSALNLLLKDSHLTWIIKEDVLQITTPKHTRGAHQTTTYPVADLVIPVYDFGQVKSPNAPQLLVNDISRPPSGPMPQSPYVTPASLAPGESTGSASTGRSMFGSEGNQPQAQVNRSAPQGTTEDKLKDLIKNTIDPNSWSDAGGQGTIDYFPLTMSLVINQTPDIQEQIADLLGALRRLQDQEVAVEIRFVTIDDSFFERIGVDFNMNIQTKNTSIQPQLSTGVFTPEGYINAFAPKNTVIGLQPTGTFTPDLNVPIQTNTYAATVPDFGGYQPIPGFGGLTLGLAFLSDIQVFLFLEAVQGDTRSNVMQAPKLTMFNGQTASLTVSDFQNFVTGVSVGQQGGLYTFTPVIQQFPLGVNLAMQAVISADRRFVRMSLAPQLQNLASQTVNLFPVVVPIFTNFDEFGVGQPVLFTQYVQQPIVNSVSVQTTVAVPDGGTVLMGGLKLLSEERKEYGPPILSKIPYLNRLFKNTSYGRDAQSLLIMVTPRIIIQEEEEFKQTGYERPVQQPF